MLFPTVTHEVLTVTVIKTLIFLLLPTCLKPPTRPRLFECPVQRNGCPH